ncbi:class I SAM-dependent methyltransferase [Luteimonas gilva]|uniref:Class I SAM-dependent methyltransferase n=1 Tax=Luteimonas gilva TaxID=2572684 RepID=A0A4U5JJH0_9GAMM|nr:class I SAM-dependent methyltransferase [Luteimonas gilva]TKR29720.1 class I SAM-dependent methyltransferase [Luteimonas gilva]
MHKQALSNYVEGEQHRLVEGWLGDGAISLILAADRRQKAAGVRGPVLEIGVHHGRLFLLFAMLARSDEKALALDLFEDQHLNIDWSGRGDRAALWKNIDTYLGDRERVIAIRANSLDLGPNSLDEHLSGQKVRLLSVDGGHTREHVLNDLALASAWLHADGIVFVDDFYNADWPGVNEGVVRYLTDPAHGLAPLCYGDNKLLMCKREGWQSANAWLTTEFLPTCAAYKKVAFCDYETYHVTPPAPSTV